MTAGSPSHRVALFTVTIVVGALLPSAGRGAEPPSSRSNAPAVDSDKEARGLFAQGQIHYSLGEYEQAIADFRRAYELTSAPGLLFNIAQAHRLAGQCKQALEVYRHFTRLLPDSEYRGEADTHIASLAARCGTTEASVPSSVPSPAPNHQANAPALLQLSQASAAPERSAHWSARRRSAAALLATGIGAGLAAGAVYWWNDGRYDRWREEDERLATAMPGTAPSAWIADQERNDALWRSVQRADTVGITLVGLSVAAVVASSVLALISER